MFFSVDSFHCPAKPAGLEGFLLVYRVLMLPCNAKELQDNVETCREPVAKESKDLFWKAARSLNYQNIPEKYIFTLN